MCSRVIALVVSVAALSGAARADQRLWETETTEFLQALNAPALSTLPVRFRGRSAILDTLARHELARSLGRTDIDDVAPAAAWLELYFNAGLYLDRPILPVRERRMRDVLAQHLPPDHADALRKTGRIAPGFLLSESALTELLMQNRATVEDIRNAGELPYLAEILQALAARPGFRVPVDRLRTRVDAWLAHDAFHLAPGPDGTWPAMTTEEARIDPTVMSQWRMLAGSWQLRDAPRVGRSLEKLTARIEAIGSEQVAGRTTRQLEWWYNRLDRTTFTWMGFASAVVLLMLALARVRPRGFWRIAGLVVGAVSTAALAVGFVVRWILSGSAWYLPPIMNQFEAVTAAALLAAGGGLLWELASRRGIGSLAGCVVAAVAMLCGALFPLGMNATPSATVGILSSPIMAAHVGIIILGHALAAMTAVTAVMYLAGSVIARGAPEALRDEESLLAGLDRFHGLAVPLAVWTIGVGIALGAVWADFAWNRWWGWDRKETWALLTWGVFLIAWHVRLRAVDPARRGAVTAWLCLLGAGAMLFNWIVVNYFLTGLHSYA